MNIDPEATTVSLIRRTDADKQIVYGAVYVPNEIDTWGEMMLAEDIELMAHRFMRVTRMGENIDTMHDETPNGAYPVESFIARAGDIDYVEGTWVLGVKITDSDLWAKVKKGEINAFSFQALVKKVAVVVDIEYDPEAVGVTEENAGHSHLYYARLDSDGKVVSGVTSTELGHSHAIKKASATEESAGHSHRFFS